MTTTPKTVTATPKVQTGIDDDARDKIADGLANVLADTFTLYLKTHNYHWNVTGPHFPQLHGLFETQYDAMWAATDTLAERIRALGRYAPASYKAYEERTSVEGDSEANVPDATTMVRNLLAGHETVIRTIRPILSKAAEADDEATVDLLTQRLDAHEKDAWMLRSFLG